jgi:hypothetical protein
LFVFDIPMFNERVVHESLLNAVSHRNYQLIVAYCNLIELMQFLKCYIRAYFSIMSKTPSQPSAGS